MAQDAEKLAEQGERLRELKKMARVTQRQISDAVGISERQVGRWLAGTSDIDPQNLKKVAAFFCSTPDYIEYGAAVRTRGATPDPFVPDEVRQQLDAIKDRLTALEDQMGQLVGLMTGDLEKTALLTDGIVKAVERALSLRAREAGLPDRRRAQPQSPGTQRPAA